MQALQHESRSFLREADLFRQLHTADACGTTAVLMLPDGQPGVAMDMSPACRPAWTTQLRCPHAHRSHHG